MCVSVRVKEEGDLLGLGRSRQRNILSLRNRGGMEDHGVVLELLWFRVTDDGMKTERMVGEEAGKVVWDLTMKRK